MRAISLINHLEFDFAGSVVRKGIALGDVDNDGNFELIVGNENGEVAIFKGLDRWCTLVNLGFVSCVVVGDILNQGRNCLVIVTADGWCYIYDSETPGPFETADVQHGESTEESVEQAFSGISIGTPKSDSFPEEPKPQEKFGKLKKIHVQRIPPNAKDILLGDIDGDGLIEMVLGLTDRVVRSYRWVENSKDLAHIDDISLEGAGDVPPEPYPGETFQGGGGIKSGLTFEILGKLIALNKWECAKQIGSISLHHYLDGTPILLVAQPGGTFMRIRHQIDETSSAQLLENLEQSDSSSSPSENLTGFSVDYQILGLSRMRNQNISTEILGDLKTVTRLNTSADSGSSDFEPRGSPQEACSRLGGIPYAVATLDGTIMLVQDEVILWSIAVDHQVFALTKLDITGNGVDEIVVCSWDGHTYILDQKKNIIRFQLNESVQAFDSGYYTLLHGSAPVTCFVYVTFRNKILLYFDIPLKNMVCKKFEPDLTKLLDLFEGDSDEERRRLAASLDKTSRKQLVEYLLYGVRSD